MEAIASLRTRGDSVDNESLSLFAMVLQCSARTYLLVICSEHGPRIASQTSQIHTHIPEHTSTHSSSMKGAKPTITKNTAKGLKGDKQAGEHHEISPVSVKHQPRPTRVGVSEPRSFDFSKVNLKAIVESCQPTTTTIGQFINHAKSVLHEKQKGTVDVLLTATPIRLPEEWENFRFFSLADLTGSVYLGAKVSTFDVLHPYFEDRKTHVPSVSWALQAFTHRFTFLETFELNMFSMLFLKIARKQVKISGSVTFRLSTRNNGELYATLKDKSDVQEVTVQEAIQGASCVSAMIHILSDSLYSSSVFPRIVGDCVLAQDDADGSFTVLLRDASGRAIIQV